MIGKLKGVIDSYGEDFIVLDVQGVGYLVHCSARTLQALPAPGEAATLSIETHVREDQIRLMLRVLLPKADPQTHDAADALAIAVTHAHHRHSALLKLKVAAAR